MRWKGWFRLWIVASVLVVPTISFTLARSDMAMWERLNASGDQICADQQANLVTHPDALRCEHMMGSDQTVFQREHTTPAVYWGEALLVGIVADLLITGMIALAVAAVLWVRRGFATGDTRVKAP